MYIDEVPAGNPTFVVTPFPGLNSMNYTAYRCDESTSVCTDSHSLKDEDAWLPILNIAEEEVYFIFVAFASLTQMF